MFNTGKLTCLDAFQRRKWRWSTFSAGAYAATRFLDSFKLAWGPSLHPEWSTRRAEVKR